MKKKINNYSKPMLSVAEFNLIINNNNIYKMKITVEKETLIEAQQLYNTAAFENPENFREIELTEECAENQVNALLSYLPEYHQEEVSAEIRTKIVAEFIDFCKLNGTQISDKLFENFFGA